MWRCTLQYKKKIQCFMQFMFYICFEKVQHKLHWNLGSVLKLLLSSSTASCYQKLSSDISHNFVNDLQQCNGGNAWVWGWYSLLLFGGSQVESKTKSLLKVSGSRLPTSGVGSFCICASTSYGLEPMLNCRSPLPVITALSLGINRILLSESCNFPLLKETITIGIR
jgi:hypothetical protein